MQIKRLGDLCNIKQGQLIRLNNLIPGEYELAVSPYFEKKTHKFFNAPENTITISKLGQPLHQYSRECISIERKEDVRHMSTLLFNKY